MQSIGMAVYMGKVQVPSIMPMLSALEVKHSLQNVTVTELLQDATTMKMLVWDAQVEINHYSSIS